MCIHDATRSEIECVYSPSHWNVLNVSPEEALTTFRSSVWDDHVAIFRKSIPNSIYRYAPGERSFYEVWGEPSKCKSLFIFLHGGYWQFGSLGGVAPLVESLLDAQVLVASIGYDYGTPQRPLTDLAEDAAEAIRQIVRRYDSIETVVVGGHSAGAHLAFRACSFIDEPRIKGLVLFAGVYEFYELVGTYIGEPLGLTVEEAKRSECRAEDFKEGRSALVVVGKQDAPRFVEDSNRLHYALRARGIQSEIEALDGHDHFTIIKTLLNASHPLTKTFVNFCTHPLKK